LRGAGAPPPAAFRAAGVDVVLSRPCSVGEIVAAARRLLHRTASGQTGRVTDRQ
jgi:DNA-binding response OmpR family regulator